MKNLLIGIIFLGLTSPSYSQIIDPVELASASSSQAKNELASASSSLTKIKPASASSSLTKNVSYVDRVQNKNTPIGVKHLERYAANLDVTKFPAFKNNYDTYEIVFKSVAGNVLATYDDKGMIINTFEKFYNVPVTDKVKNAISKEYPEWKISSTVYKVTYYNNENTKKVYQVKIAKDDEIIHLKIDSEGNFLKKEVKMK